MLKTRTTKRAIQKNNENNISEYIEIKASQGYCSSTLNTHKKYLNHASKTVTKMFHVSLLDVDEKQLQKYVSLSRSTTAKTRISILKSFREYFDKPLNMSKVHIVVRSDDATPVQAPLPEKIAELYELDIKPIYSFLLALLIETGVRIGKAVSLTHNDFNVDLGLLVLEHTKGGEQRTVPLTDELISKYRTVFENSQIKSDRKNERLFKFGDSQALKIVQKIGKMVNIRLSPHALRKYFAVREYYKTKDIVHVQGLLGHKNALTTSKYLNSNYYKIYSAFMERG